MLRLTLPAVTTGLALAVPPVRAEAPEGEAVAFVGKRGGKVFRDEGRPGRPLAMFRLDGTGTTDAGLGAPAAFTELKDLGLSLTRITDAGLKDVAALKSLETLRMGDTRVTDAGLKDLAALTKLTELCPSGGDR